MTIPMKYEDVVAQLALEREQAESTLGELEDLVEKLNNALCEIDSLQQRLTVAEQRAEMLEREFRKLRDVAHGCFQIASSYSGCIDGVEEGGGDDHDDPSCAIYHRLYYAMFDADKALKPAAEVNHGKA